MSKLILPEVTKLVTALAPATDAAGRTGDYISLKGAARAFIVCNIKQGSSSTIELSVNQATAVAGTSAKAITNDVPIWANLDAATSDTLVRATDGVNYTTDAALKDKVVVFQIDAASLDTNNDFDCVAVVTGASDASNITSAMYVLTDIRFQQATPPSAIVD